MQDARRSGQLQFWHVRTACGRSLTVARSLSHAHDFALFVTGVETVPVCDPFPLRPLPRQAIANLAFTDAAAKTKWSNLPGQARSGIQLSALSTEQLATAKAVKAVKAVASVALSAAGCTDARGRDHARVHVGPREHHGSRRARRRSLRPAEGYTRRA